MLNATRPHRSRALAIVLAAVVALVAAGCGSDDGGDETADTSPVTQDITDVQTGGKLVIGIDAESDGYNPTTKRFAHSGHMVASAVFDTLATIDEKGDAVPYLAESIEPNADFTEWTVTLRPDVVFHDDTPLTAQAVAEVFNFHKNDSLVTSSSLIDVDSIEAVDDLTVLFKLRQPWASFPFILTTQVGYVMAPSMLTDPESGAMPVGTGPFKFESWDRQVAWDGTRWDKYWQKDDNGVQLPYTDEIEFRIYPDPSARQEALESGDVDLIHTVTPASIVSLRESGFEVVEWNRGEEDIVALQTEVPPFDNVHARRALAYATDQAKFLEEVQQGVYLEANGPMAPGQLGFVEDTGYPTYDPDKAREELALYTADTGQQTLTFAYNGSDDVANLTAQQYLVDMWAEVGIVANIQAMTQADVIFNAVTGQYEATDWRNWGQTDPDADYQWWHSSSNRPLEEGISLNIAHFSDDEIEAALEEARGSTDESTRDDAYQVLGRRFAEDVPYIILGRVVWAMAAADNVHNWQIGSESGTISTLGSKSWIASIWLS
jgi:peptide/nickel transport system substrate-binding protein